MILYTETFSKKENKWVERQILLSDTSNDTEYGFTLPEGEVWLGGNDVNREDCGILRLYPQYVGEVEGTKIQKELIKSKKPHKFRQYCIRSTPEPRAQMLLHEDATPRFGRPQPGYGYARINMKARPLRYFPMVQALANKSKIDLGVKKWNIGAHVVMYRDGQDNMGAHSDDDQGETCIFTVIIKAPTKGRAVLIEPKNVKDGSARFELWPKRGDAYEMDGALYLFVRMQSSFLASLRFIMFIADHLAFLGCCLM
jgi:alkylated DNA repair dioxygenase AlkB